MTRLATSASPIAVWFGAVYLTQKFASPALLENDGAANLTCYFKEIGGHRVPVVNASMFMSSELAGELAEGHPFAGVYVESEAHTLWSLRSRPGGVDVSEVAKQFGGGGHKHAAGFREARS